MPIGIDFGARQVRAAQVARAGDRWRVVAAGARALPMDLPDEGEKRSRAQAAALRDLLESSSFVGRRAVSCLPASAVQYKNLRLPPMPPHELRAAVEWEASDRLKFGQNYQVQFFDAGEVRQGEELRQEIILMAAPSSTVERHVAVLTECGLTPEAVDVTPGALSRWAAVEAGESQDAQLIVDIGATGSSVLISRLGRVMFFKRLELGGRRAEEAVAGQMRTSLQEASRILQVRAAGHAEDGSLAGSVRREGASQALSDVVRPLFTDVAREIGLCLRYHCVTFRGTRPQSCMLAGGGAEDPLLAPMIAQETGLSAAAPQGAAGATAAGGASSRFDWSRVGEATFAQCPAPSWAVALGLSVRDERAAMRGAA